MLVDIKQIIRILDHFCTYNSRKLRFYLKIFASIHRTIKFQINLAVFSNGSILGAIIIRKYNIKWNYPYFQQYSMGELFQIFPEDINLRYVLNDDVDSLLDGLNTNNCMKLLHFAAKVGSLECFKEILKYCDLKDIEIANLSEEILREAFIGGNISIISICINYLDIDPDNKCIESAVSTHHNDIVSFFCEKYPSLSYSWESCISSLNFEMFFKKLSARNSNEAIFLIAKVNIPILTDYFLMQDINLDIKNSKNETLLMHCAIHGNFELAKQLINRGVNVNAKCDDQINALMFSAMNNTYKVARVLLSCSNIDLYDTASDGANALTLCAYFNSPDVAKVLISSGFDVNRPAIHGYTPIAIAAMKNSYKTAKVLIKANCDIERVFDNGFDSLTLAKIYNSKDVEVLLNHCYYHRYGGCGSNINRGCLIV